MVEAGVLENVEAIFGHHVATDLPTSTVASRPSPVMAGSGFFEAVIIGKGGHAAIPQHTMDPILAASNVIVSLQHGDKPHSISECSGVFNLGVSGVLR